MTRHRCGHRRCRVLGQLAALAAAIAYVATIAFLASESAWWIAVGAAAVTGHCLARYWPHPDSDIDALVSAVRDPAPTDPFRVWEGQFR